MKMASKVLKNVDSSKNEINPKMKMTTKIKGFNKLTNSFLLIIPAQYLLIQKLYLDLKIFSPKTKSGFTK